MVKFLQVSGHNILSPNQPITLSYACSDLMISNLIYIIGSLTLNSLPKALIIQHLCLNKTYLSFLHKALHSLRAPRDTRQHHSWGRDIFKSKIASEKRKERKHMALNRPHKGHFFSFLLLSWELKQKVRASPCSTSAGNVRVGQLNIFIILSMLVNDCKSAITIDIKVTSKL